MHSANYKIEKSKFFVIYITILCFSMFCVLYNYKPINIDSFKYVLSVLGWCVWGFCLYTWKSVTGSVFTLYTVFLSFLILFNYGQCLMWAIGIHIPKEIGKYPCFGVNVSELSIYRTQLLTLMGTMAFHCGAVLSYKNMREKAGDLFIDPDIERDRKAVMASIARITLFVSAICTFIECMNAIVITRTYGYGANLYNANVVDRRNNLLILISWMFMPSIIAMLLANDYEKSTVVVCYGLFAINALLEILAGDRGFVYWLGIIVWMHHTYYKRISARRAVFYGFLGVIVVMICAMLSKIRGDSIDMRSLLKAFSSDENLLASAFFELGNSMKPAIILVDRNVVYPYGNTYLLALCGMITERVITMFKPNYIGIGSWFSQEYLRLSYGADFSILAEAYLNFGTYGSVLFLFFLGMIIRTCIDIQNKKDVFSAFLKISTCCAIIVIVRGTMLNGLKHVVFSTMVLYVAMLFCESLMCKKRMK